MKIWNSAKEFFDSLNNEVVYVVLRNHENLPDELFSADHPDIDFLTMDLDLFNTVSKSESRSSRKIDSVHRKINISGNEIAVDVRSVGDGYYDKRWEQDMLAGRVYDNRGFYILDGDNYFYSLIYHAIVQKKTFSDDYKTRLQEMRGKNGLINDKTLLEMLEAYMIKKQYCYSYPAKTTCFNIAQVDPELIEKSIGKKVLRYIWNYLHRLRFGE